MKSILVVCLIIPIILSSCISSSIIRNGGEFYYETNVLVGHENETKLEQTVVFNNIKNGLHSYSYSLKFEILDNSRLKKGHVFRISKDTSFFKVEYLFNSNRRWDVKSNSIVGNIKIIDITNDSIKIKENIVVLDELGKRVKFKGTRMFKKNESNNIYPKMKRNRKKIRIFKNN